jgi:hypothetical protein
VDCGWSTTVPDSDVPFITYFEGDFQVFFADQQGFAPNTEEWMVQFDGQVSVDQDMVNKLTFDFWWNNGTITTRVPLSDGSWFFVGNITGTLTYLFQDIQGTIECDFEERVCTSNDHPIGSITF